MQASSLAQNQGNANMAGDDQQIDSSQRVGPSASTAAVTQPWTAQFRPEAIKAVSGAGGQINRFKAPEYLGQTSLINQFMMAKDKETRQTAIVDKGSAIEYLKPIIPKRYCVTKKQTYTEETGFSYNVASSSFQAPVVFYYTTGPLQQAASNWLAQSSYEFTSPTAYEEGFTEITWADVGAIITSPTADINDEISKVLRNKKMTGIAAVIVRNSLLSSSFSSQRVDFTSAGSPTFADPVVSVDAAQSALDLQGMNLFTGFVKFLHILKHCVAGPFSDDAKLNTLWDFKRVNVSLIPRDAFRYGNQSYISAHNWYESRAMIKLNEVTKLVFKPVAVELGKIFPNWILQRSEVPLPTAIAVRYEPQARQTYMENLKVAGAASTSYLQNVMKDRVVILEAECRSVKRFGALTDFTTAKLRWASKRTFKSGKSALDSFISEELYNKLRTGLKAEADLVFASATGNPYNLEWPTAKIGSFGFIRDVMVTCMTVDWGQMSKSGAVFLDAQAMVKKGDPKFQLVDFLTQSFKLNYSLVSKFIWERKVMAPVLERVQFTKNLKSSYYIKELLQSRSLARQSLVFKDIGMVLKKKNRAQLKAVVQQSTLKYDQITMPFVQSALHWFKVYDMTSMNIRRLLCFTLYHAFNNQTDTYSGYAVNPWLQALRFTKEPRYVVAAGKSGQMVDLDMWHDAYKYLAESGIRSTVRKKLTKIFKYMKRMQKVQNVFADRAALEGNQAGIGSVKAFNHANDSTLSVFGLFFLCCELGRTPTFINSQQAGKGFHAHNVYASNRFAQIINGIGDPLLYDNKGRYGDHNYEKVFIVLRDQFLANMKTRRYTVGVEEDGYTPKTIPNEGAADELYEQLITFCRGYYPGVSTLVNNKFVADQNGGETSLALLMQANGFTLAQTVDFYCTMAMFFELFETGIILLQTFNTAYFKNVSDFSFGMLCFSWFKMVGDLAGSILTQHVLVPSQAAFRNVYSRPLIQFRLLAQYIYKDIVRPPRPDRVSSKTTKKKEEYLLFFGLTDIVGAEYTQKMSSKSSLYDRDKKDARRGPELNITGLRNVDNSQVFDALKQVKDAVMLQRKDTLGILGKRTKGGRTRMIAQQLTGVESSRKDVYQQPGGLLSQIDQQAAAPAGQQDAQIQQQPPAQQQQ